MNYILYFKGPEGNLHIVNDYNGAAFVFDENTIPVIKVNLHKDCALYQLDGTKAYLITGEGFQEDFPRKKQLTLYEQGLFKSLEGIL